jgi:hypothetical protein
LKSKEIKHWWLKMKIYMLWWNILFDIFRMLYFLWFEPVLLLSFTSP